MRTNGSIRAAEVRLIDFNGAQLGVVSLAQALATAQERGMDLIEIAPQASPPVCKILDFSKFKYEREKKLKLSRKKHHGGQLKEIRFRPKIGEHDFQTKLKAISNFLAEKDKVRVIMFFRGREMEHQDLGMKLLARLRETFDKIAIVEQSPQLNGNRLVMVLAPHH